MKILIFIVLIVFIFSGCSSVYSVYDETIDEIILSQKDEMELKKIVSFKWDKAYTFESYKDSDYINEVVGTDCKGAKIYDVNTRLIVFVKNNKTVYNYYTKKIGFFPSELYLDINEAKFIWHPLESDKKYFELKNESVITNFRKIKVGNIVELRDTVPFRYENIFIFPNKISDEEIIKVVPYYEQTKSWDASQGLCIFEVKGIKQYYNLYYNKNQFDFNLSDYKKIKYKESYKMKCTNEGEKVIFSP